MGGFGQLFGGILGAAAGTAIAPGIGTTIGGSLGSQVGGSLDSSSSSTPAATNTTANGGGGGIGDNSNNTMKQGVGYGMGALQLIQSMRDNNKANASLPGLIDPNQAAFAAELAQKRKALDTGAEYASGLNAVDQTTANTQDAITKVTGGDVGGTVQGLLQAERVGGAGKNEVVAQGAKNQLVYNNMYQELMNKIAARKLQLQMYQSQQALAQGTQEHQDGVANILAAAGYAPKPVATATTPAAINTTPTVTNNGLIGQPPAYVPPTPMPLFKDGSTNWNSVGVF